MSFVMWCRWGARRLDADDRDAAVAEALFYAAKYGFAVTVTDADFDDIAVLPPTYQTDAILPLLFGEIVPEVSPALN
jgi:hypothetical protein